MNTLRSQFNPKYSVTLSESATDMFPNYQAPDSLVMIEAQLGPGGGKLKTGSELKRNNSVKSIKSVKSVKSVRCEGTLKVAARRTCLALSMNKKHFLHTPDPNSCMTITFLRSRSTKKIIQSLFIMVI